MKNILLFFLAVCFFLGTYPTYAFEAASSAKPTATKKKSVKKDEASSSSIPGQGLVLSFGPMVDPPLHNWNQAYTFGGGGHLDLGYRFDPAFTFGLGFDYLHFYGTNFAGAVSDNDLRILAGIRYYFWQDGFRPYGTAQAGVAIQIIQASVGEDANFNFDGALGLGVEWGLGNDALFIEARYNLIPAGGAVGQDLPIGAGIRFGF